MVPIVQQMILKLIGPVPACGLSTMPQITEKTHTLKDIRRKDCKTGIDNTYHSHGSNNFSAQFIKIISHYEKIVYYINVLQQIACLVVNPITVGNFAFLFNCTPAGRTSNSMTVST